MRLIFATENASGLRTSAFGKRTRCMGEVGGISSASRKLQKARIAKAAACTLAWQMQRACESVKYERIVIAETCSIGLRPAPLGVAQKPGQLLPIITVSTGAQLRHLFR